MSQAQVGVSVGPLVHWRAVVGAGLIAGVVFLMFEMIMLPLFLGLSPWAPPRMMAAIVLGKGVLPPPATFDFGVVMVAMMIHFMLAIVYAFVITGIAQRQGTASAIGIGAAAGLVLYLLNFYVLTAAFPWFAMARNWVSVTGHILFGLTGAWSYRALVKE